MTHVFDLVIIGAGPVGLAAALEAKKQNLHYVILEKGVLVNSIFHFPSFMRFFTTAALLEIGNHPFPSTDVKPTRQMTLDYYRRIADLEELKVWLHHEVNDVSKGMKLFTINIIESRRGVIKSKQITSKTIIIATGYFDNPKGLGNIPGEDGPNVSYYYSEPHQFYDQDVVVIGGGNSGAEASLDLFRHGARVVLIHNDEKPRTTLKYWVGPDLTNRLKSKEIGSYMPAKVTKIDEGGVTFVYKEQTIEIPADMVFILTGFTPNISFLQSFGISIKKDLSVELDENFETNIQGVYVIGSAGFGKNTNSVFIENGREHAIIAVQNISKKL